MLKLTALLLFLFPAFCFAQDNPVKTTMLDGRVELYVPAALKKMTDEIWTFKYHSNKKPPLAMTDDNAEVNLIGDYTQQPIDTLQIVEFEDIQIGFAKKSRPGMELIEKGVKIINGKTFGYFKFVIQATDQKVFNYYFFTALDGKVLRFSFNCIESLRAKWEDAAEQIVQSVKVN